MLKVSHETRARSLTKGITWRFLATFVTMTVVYIFTGNVSLTLGIGILEMITKLIIYFLHERAWDRIKWGRIHVKEDFKL